MSLAFELITSVLVGAPILADHHGGADRQHRQNALLIALDPAAFGDSFTTEVDGTVRMLKNLPTAEGVDAVLVPGDRSAAVAAGRRKEGVPVPAKVWTQLTEAAQSLGAPLPTHA